MRDGAEVLKRRQPERHQSAHSRILEHEKCAVAELVRQYRLRAFAKSVGHGRCIPMRTEVFPGIPGRASRGQDVVIERRYFARFPIALDVVLVGWHQGLRRVATKSDKQPSQRRRAGAVHSGDENPYACHMRCSKGVMDGAIIVSWRRHWALPLRGAGIETSVQGRECASYSRPFDRQAPRCL